MTRLKRSLIIPYTVSPYGEVFHCVQFPLPSGTLQQQKFIDIWATRRRSRKCARSPRASSLRVRPAPTGYRRTPGYRCAPGWACRRSRWGAQVVAVVTISPILPLPCDCVFDRHGIPHTPGRIQNLEADDIAVLVVVQDHAGLILVALLNRRVAQHDAEHVYFRIVLDFHSGLQYFAILLVRYTVTTSGGSLSIATTASPNTFSHLRIPAVIG